MRIRDTRYFYDRVPPHEAAAEFAIPDPQREGSGDRARTRENGQTINACASVETSRVDSLVEREPCARATRASRRPRRSNSLMKSAANREVRAVSGAALALVTRDLA